MNLKLVQAFKLIIHPLSTFKVISNKRHVRLSCSYTSEDFKPRSCNIMAHYFLESSKYDFKKKNTAIVKYFSFKLKNDIFHH